MSPSFSIISTLIEAFKLAQRHARLILALAVLSDIPSTALQFGLKAFMHASSTTMDKRGLYESVLSLAMVVIGTWVAAMVAGAILGVLSNPTPAVSVWTTALESLRRHTWRLFRLSILLTCIAGLITFPASLIMLTMHPRSGPNTYMLDFFVMLTAILYIVFAKYALADPLVVVEGMAPVAALRRSWRMTRGRFGYVLGCYVFLGTAEYFIGSFFLHFESYDSFTWIDPIDSLLSSLIGCIWILMAWCMYVRIKSAEDMPAADRPDALGQAGIA